MSRRSGIPPDLTELLLNARDAFHALDDCWNLLPKFTLHPLFSSRLRHSPPALGRSDGPTEHWIPEILTALSGSRSERSNDSSQCSG
jgi:hypothetical protein